MSNTRSPLHKNRISGRTFLVSLPTSNVIAVGPSVEINSAANIIGNKKGQSVQYTRLKNRKEPAPVWKPPKRYFHFRFPTNRKRGEGGHLIISMQK